MLLDLLDPEDFPFFLRPGLDLILVDFNTANIVFVDGVVALLVKGTLMISLTAAFVVTFGAAGANEEGADGGPPDVVNEDEVEVDDHTHVSDTVPMACSRYTDRANTYTC